MGRIAAAVAVSLSAMAVVACATAARPRQSEVTYEDSCSLTLQVRRRGDEQMFRDLEELKAKYDGIATSAHRREAIDGQLYQLWNSTAGLSLVFARQQQQLQDMRGNLDGLAEQLAKVKKKLRSVNGSAPSDEQLKVKKEASSDRSAIEVMQGQYNGIMGEVFLIKEREEKLIEDVEAQHFLFRSLQAQVINMTRSVVELESALQQTANDGSTSAVSGRKYSGSSLPRDCFDHLAMGHQISGVYDVYLSASADHATQVHCHFGGEAAWTLLQRRTDGSLSFNRGWADYEFGFGNIYGEFWFGNAYMNLLTSRRDYRLRIEAEDWSGGHGWAEYDRFRVGDRSTNYHLSIGRYLNGTLGDALSLHNNTPFSARDDGNDMLPLESSHIRSGWWHRREGTANLNGHYYDGSQNSEKALANGIIWNTWQESSHHSLKRVTMKMAAFN